MSVVALFMMLSTVVGLGERPPEVAGSDQAAYAKAVWDNEVEQDTKMSGQRCETSIITSTSVTLLRWTDLTPKPSGTTRVVDGNILKSRVTTVTEYDPHEMRGVIEHLRVEACGRTRLANLLMFREWDPKTGQQTGRLRAMGLLDGNSIAEPRLQMDAVPDAAKVLLVQAVRAQPKECPTSTALNTFRFGQTIVLKPPVDKAWTELWPATVCGQPYAALMEFTPNPKGPGTQFKVSPFSLLNATAAATTKP